MDVFYYAMGLVSASSALCSGVFIRDLLQRKSKIAGDGSSKAKMRMNYQILAQLYNIPLQIIQICALLLVLNNNFIAGVWLSQITSTGILVTFTYYLHVDFVILEALVSLGVKHGSFSWMSIFRIFVNFVAAIAILIRIILAILTLTFIPELGNYGNLVDIAFTIFTLICDNYMNISIISFIVSKSTLGGMEGARKISRITIILAVMLICEWTTVFFYALVVYFFSYDQPLQFAAGTYAIAISGFHSVITQYVLSAVKRLLIDGKREAVPTSETPPEGERENRSNLATQQ